MYSKRLILGYGFLLCFSVLSVYVSGLEVLAKIWGALLFYCILAYIISSIWSIFRYRGKKNFLHFFVTFLYKVSITMSIFLIVFTSFTIYQNTINPAKLPAYTLSNGDKTVVFQTMSHIASENFYGNIKKNIFDAKKTGYILFFEGVRSGTQENHDAFNSLLGIDFKPGLYENLSKMYGVVAQNNDSFLGILNDKDYNIDISIDEIMDIYREKQIGKVQEESSGILENEKILDLNEQVIEELAGLSEKELFVLRYINQSFLNFMMKHESLRNVIIEKLGKEDIFSVILHDRNKNLAHEIELSSKKKIYVIYGLMHFEGVLELLQASDSSWEIIGSDYLQVIGS